MPAEQAVLANINNGTQVSQLLSASGSKTFTVGKVSTAAAGKGMVSLTPSNGGSAIMVKLEGVRQTTEISALAGKTVEYIVGRLNQYKAGEKVGSQSNLMWGQAAMLSDTDMSDIAEYIQTM